MPSGTVVKDRPIQGNAGTGGDKQTISFDQGSITHYVEDPSKEYYLPIFGSVSKKTKRIRYSLATASVIVEVNGVQLKKDLRVAIPDGELVKDLKASLQSLDSTPTAKTAGKVQKKISKGKVGK